MKEIEYRAQASVGRGCGYAGAAIIATVLALSGNPATAAWAGAILSFMLMTALLVVAAMTDNGLDGARAWLTVETRKRPKRRTGLPDPDRARRQAMLWFAGWSGLTSALFAIIAVVLASFQTN